MHGLRSLTSPVDTNAEESEIVKLKRLLVQKEKALQKQGVLLDKTNEHLEDLEQELDDEYASKYNGRSRALLESEDDEDNESSAAFASAIRTKGVVPIDAPKALRRRGDPHQPPTPQSSSRPASPSPRLHLLTTPIDELVDYLMNSDEDEADLGVPPPSNDNTTIAQASKRSHSTDSHALSPAPKMPKAKTSEIMRGNAMPCFMKLFGVEPFPDGAKSREMAEQVWAEVCEDYDDLYELTTPMAIMMQKRGTRARGQLKDHIRPLVAPAFGLTSPDKKSMIAKNKDNYLLTTNAAFHYKDLPTLSHAYEHKIIFSSICAVWFKNIKDFGVKYSDRFDPIPNVSLALVLTASTGSYIQGTLNESEDKGRYINFLKDVEEWTGANAKVTKNIRERWHNRARKNTGAANRVVVAGHMNEDAIMHAKKDMENRTGETDSEDEGEGEEGAPGEPAANRGKDGAGIGGSQIAFELG
ncbi:hypothetical protein EDD18DRAFT_1113819 [Armillaria luteobubalina]|uniref:DUF6532 domain-containing protein n=1 Tax=Armillaria luteobubalina TaxID=153913 RepID=A0AA39P8C5_9AGAR|nr:hypothetical protein EDD18DRAFT_1113819 [Armillaria luteobubalina]